MVKPIPDNVKEILSQLSSSQQVLLRSYIATLQSEIVTFEEEALNADNKDDANAGSGSYANTFSQNRPQSLIIFVAYSFSIL